MGTTGRFGGGGAGLTGPKHVWYDTDYSELYRGLAVVIGFFLFLVLLLLIFILISYLRKWYRLKKRPADASAESAPAVSSVKGPALAPSDEAKYVKRYSKTGLPSSQPATPLVKSAPKNSLSSTSVEFVDGKMVKQGGGNGHHGHHQQYHQNIAHHHQQQHYQEFPPAHYPTHHMPGNAVQPHSILTSKGDTQPTNPRTCRPSLATITLT